MLQKWKNILTNWINCYFTESYDNEPCVTLDSLLIIISHLRENLNLDESKSAILEAHTVEEFIQEKYPSFSFSNGTVEAHTEEDLYMVASLLLFFVCVNSKDINIKNAMCNKLSSEDQEVILKFSKCLMECSPITYKDVQVAITGACSTDTMAAESDPTHSTVSETPPALRSLHSEVRRLQAALDAERFDRNYLQEELARTNLRVEKLAKDKEQYKLEIVNLKAKISLCCGQESETKSGDKVAEGTAKLMKELQETEERLVQTQGQLDDALYERDAYKAKVHELKVERDKWVNLSQQETARVAQLSEELTVERRHVQSLKELLEELRQHQQLNRLDTSQLECDDPDASIHSLPHNASICSEACANVVEVQLSEERAKIVLLKQQIQSLQEQLNDFTQKSQTEIQSLNEIVSEKENDIFNLKHRINEEIDAKNKLVIQYSDANSRLNNEINELEQKLKDNNNHYRLVLETKMQEIQTLQEEKLSLLQSLNDETTKLEGIIENLKLEMAAAKDSKLKMKEEYDNHIMKLNEKVLNRNNELVELQNTVCENSEQIERLHLELRKEKQAREEIVERYHNELKTVNSKNLEIETMLQQKNQEIENLMDKLNNNYTYAEELTREINFLKDSMSQLTAKCKDWELISDSLNKEIGIRDNKLDEQSKEIENFNNVLSEERANNKKRIDEYLAKITTLNKAVDDSRDELSRQRDSVTAILESRSRDIQTLQQENQSLIDELNDVKQQLDIKVHSLQEKLTDSEHLTEKLKNSYECQIKNLDVMVAKLTNYLKDKSIELDSLKKDKERLQEIINGNNEVIKGLEEDVKSQKDSREKLIGEFESERLVLKNMVTVTESVMEDQKISFNEVISNQIKEIERLHGELKYMEHQYTIEKAAAEAKTQENEKLLEGVIKELSVEKNAKEKLEKELDNQKQYLTNEISKLKEDIVMIESEKQALEAQLKETTSVLRKYSDEFALIKKEKIEMEKDVKSFKEEMQSMICKLTNLESRCKGLEQDSQISRQVIAQLKEQNKNMIIEISELSKDLNLKQKLVEDLQMKNDELEGLLQICQNDKQIIEESNKELKIEKDLQESELTNKADSVSKQIQEQIAFIKELENDLAIKSQRNLQIEDKLSKVTANLEILTNENEQLKLENDNNKTKIQDLIAEMSTNIVELNNQIARLNAENFKLIKSIDINQVAITSLEDELISEKVQHEKVIQELESEKHMLVNKIEISKSVIEQQKDKQNQILSEHADECAALQKENLSLKEIMNEEKETYKKQIQDKDTKIASMYKEMMDFRTDIEIIQKQFITERNNLADELNTLKTEMELKSSQIQILETQKQEISAALQKCHEAISLIEENHNEINIQKDSQETELLKKIDSVTYELAEQLEVNKIIKQEVEEKIKQNSIISQELQAAMKVKAELEQKLNEYAAKNDESVKQIEDTTIEFNKEIDKLKNENTELADIVENNNKVITSLENEVEILKQAQEKCIADFNLEREELKEMLHTYESIAEEQKDKINQVTSEYFKVKEELQEEVKALKEDITREKKTSHQLLQEKEIVLETKIRKLYELVNEKENHHKILTIEKESLAEEIGTLKRDVTLKSTQLETLQYENSRLEEVLLKYKNDVASLQDNNNELKILIDTQESEFNKKIETITKDYNEQVLINKNLECTLEEKHKLTMEIEEKVKTMNNQVEVLTKAYNRLELERNEYKQAVDEMKAQIAKDNGSSAEEVAKLKADNIKLINLVEDDKKVILNLEDAIKREKDSNDLEKLNLQNKCSILQEYQTKAEKQLEERQKEIALLDGEIKALKSKVDDEEKVLKQKDELISSVKKELNEEKIAKEKLKAEVECKEAMLAELKMRVDNAYSDAATKALRNEEWVKAVAQRDVYAVLSSERTGSHKHSGPLEKEYRDYHHQVDNTTSDLTHSSMESIKTISDLEKIIHDKNRTITTLQSDITYIKTLVADSENKLLDVTKELEVSRENCQQLSAQLKKIVHQKNEEIADLKKQVNRMSITENRASQIIKVSAKYQAIILKRISEIKSNAVLKELTNFGNPTNGDNELRRSLNAGTITMEDLENFLETTDKHLRRCSEKQIALQKERDRLIEVNKINESEIINLKKFLTELSVGFKTFGSVKDLYTQRLSRVVSVQRTVRREILNLDGHINDSTMCKLERGYAAVMQDLTECVMNLERWVERSISRTISPEKIKQAFSTDDDRASMASTTFQNTSLEVQLEELENSFQKLLEEAVRARNGEGAKDAQSVTVMEVRAEYEDKLNRMKAKMKQLYQEQMAVFKQNQRDEISVLERELVKTREKLAESSKAYEEHIKALTTELWRVGEKFLSKKDELEWERKKQRSGSLMSLQHVHSSGLVPPPRDESLRISDAHSLRSLPVHTNSKKREGRGLHMSDEEGEVFDNRWLKELSETPVKKSSPQRLSELRWRNSLCPPHLKSSYPAETQFAPAIDEDDIKCTGAASLGGRGQRKEVGITAYKKPGPPTPSKQAGRVSATDSELRESLRSEPEPQLSRKTSTPSRLRSLFRSNKNDTAEGTPRSRRLSLFRKK